MQFLVPLKIDINLLLNSIGKSDRYIQDHQDKYNYILHKIGEMRVFNKAIEADGFSPLNLDTLRSVLGQPYTSNILNELLSWGIIETDNHYIVGEKSKGYRIHPDYVSRATGRMVLKESFEKKLRKLSIDYKNRRRRTITWKNLIQFDIHTIPALQYIEAKYSTTISLLDSYKDILDTVADILSVYREVEKRMKSNVCFQPFYPLMAYDLLEKYLQKQDYKTVTLYHILVKSAENHYNNDLYAITKISEEEYFLEQPDSKSRLYTNLSNLASDLRQFLYHRKFSSSLINLDIRNSQPYLFSLLLIDEYKDRPLPADVELYIKLTSSGEFYEYVMNLLNIQANERGKFKTTFFATIFFCTTHYSKRTAEGKAFNQHFPNVYELVNYYKEESYNNLAIQMQRREANIILKVIGKELEDRNLWFGTIHDSIVILEEHAEEAKSLIIEAFQAAIGIPPTIKVESFSMVA